jgi:hypothetical protein
LVCWFLGDNLLENSTTRIIIEHNIEFAPFLPKTVKRFSISTENVLFFIDGLTIFLKWNQDGAEPLTPYKKSLKPLLAYKNSLLINTHFMSRFCFEEE